MICWFYVHRCFFFHRFGESLRWDDHVLNSRWKTRFRRKEKCPSKSLNNNGKDKQRRTEHPTRAKRRKKKRAWKKVHGFTPLSQQEDLNIHKKERKNMLTTKRRQTKGGWKKVMGAHKKDTHCPPASGITVDKDKLRHGSRGENKNTLYRIRRKNKKPSNNIRDK